MKPLFIISAIAGILLKPQDFRFFLSNIFLLILENSDILFDSVYKCEYQISQAAGDNSTLVRWNERVVIMHSYAVVIEMKRANVRDYAFVRRVIEIKRMNVNYSFAESFACIQIRTRNFVYAY